MFRWVTCDRHKLPALIRLSFSHQPISRSTRFSSSVTLVESRSSALLLHSPTLIYGKVSAPKSSGMDTTPDTHLDDCCELLLVLQLLLLVSVFRFRSTSSDGDVAHAHTAQTHVHAGTHTLAERNQRQSGKPGALIRSCSLAHLFSLLFQKRGTCVCVCVVKRCRE